MLKIAKPRINEQFPFLDGIRGIAILTVFISHAFALGFGHNVWSWAGLFPDFDAPHSFLAFHSFILGGKGVPVLFLLSGFCIHLSRARNPTSGWKTFFRRRFFRIFPPYFLALCFFALVPPWGSFSQQGTFANFGAHVLFLHNLDERTIYGINPSFWTNAVEVQLYALYPLLLFISARMGWRRALMIAGGLELSLRAFAGWHGIYHADPLPRYLTESCFSFWFSWSLGAYLAECFLKGQKSRLFSVGFGPLAALSVVLPLCKPTAPFATLVVSWLAAVALERLITRRWPWPEAHRGPLRVIWSHLSLLGVVSYSFYLIHQPLLGLTAGILGAFFPETVFHPLAKVAFCLTVMYPLILALSHLGYRKVELPSIQLGRTTWERPADAATIPEPTR